MTAELAETGTDPTAYAITVRDVYKHYGDFVALDHVDFVVPAGSLTALLGPSGSGKSTLLRTIAGLDQPDSGSVTINGRDVTRVAPQRRGIGFVFQHYAAFKHLTVRDNVAYGLKIRKRPKAEIKDKVDNLLEVVGLSGYHGRYPNQLAGGQRQRMALARALAVDPQVLLLDEPFGALDAKVREDLRAWLRRLHDEVHVTTVLVTHDQAEALDVADRIICMRRGQVVADQPSSSFDKLSLLALATAARSAVSQPDADRPRAWLDRRWRAGKHGTDESAEGGQQHSRCRGAGGCGPRQTHHHLQWRCR